MSKHGIKIEYPSLEPLAFLVFPGGPSDSKIFDEIVAELMRRKILREGDFFVLDKGFYAYKHCYTDGLLRYGIVPMIFPRKNFKHEKVLNSIQLTLDFFNDKAYRMKKKIQHLKTILGSSLFCMGNSISLLSAEEDYMRGMLNVERP